MELQQVRIEPLSLERFEGLVGGDRWHQLQRSAEEARTRLGDRIVWNVNSTATGGGVAEMLQVLLAYARGAGVDARWLVAAGDPSFFATTKRLHNCLHGSPGDGGPLGPDEHRHYEEVMARNAEALLSRVRPGDVILLHDPQTAGLVRAMVEAGLGVVWRCHVGSDRLDDENVDRAWSFLLPYLADAHAYVFSRQGFVPSGLDAGRVVIIPPSIDPFAPKNEDLEPDAVRAILVATGLVSGHVRPEAAVFTRRDGSAVPIESTVTVVRSDGPLPPDAPLVVQVSRWDRLKDMEGVMRGFADHVQSQDARLALVGPDVSGVTDDPEGQAVLDECTARWQSLSPEVRGRVQLVSVPMTDIEENAAIINALQRHATIIVQKSLAEGFGLTVAEAMWKGRPVVASRVGGIQDQIVDGESGLLLDDAHDLAGLGSALTRLLGDRAEAEKLGANAKARVTDRFLGDRHLIQYVRLFDGMG